MTKLSFLADEHVKRSYITALRQNGFEVRSVSMTESGESDDEHLTTGQVDNLVIITNDDDFVRLGRTHSHSGVIYYSQQNHEPSDFVTAIRRIDHHFVPKEIENHIEWLENWL